MMDEANQQKSSKEVELVNLTPHELNFLVEGKFISVPASGQVARLSMKTYPVESVNGIPVVETVQGKLLGLPDPVEGKVYLVSSVVAKEVMRLSESEDLRRDDVLSPDTTDEGVVRDGKGNIIAVTRLQRFR